MTCVCNCADRWAQLTAAKPAWTEPHAADELDVSIAQYYAAIKSGRGGLYIAVCRGKVGLPFLAVGLQMRIRRQLCQLTPWDGTLQCASGACRAVQVSEGINFADEHARAVVVLGVPYPSLKDSKVNLKKQYNSHPANRRRGLVSGEDWYALQAYRAMNQV